MLSGIFLKDFGRSGVDGLFSLFGWSYHAYVDRKNPKVDV